MPNKLRKFIFSVPVIAVAGLFALYLAGGFFALPAVVKRQIEKQMPEKLGHRIGVGEVRFNPLALRFEIGDLALSDPEGGPLPSFKRLQVDLELRSVIEEEPLPAQALLQLAARRAEAIVRELTTARGVPAARVTLGKPRQATDTEDKAVAVQLQLEVAK